MNKAQKQVAQAQLNREKQAIKELKQVYQRALRDCEQKIRELSERTDMENLQSIIYQKQYQEALKAQLEGVLSNLQSNSYATVSDYLTKCYRDGYTGVMYDLQKTGIPIIMPIDQAAVVRAIQTDSKLSKLLYDKMGEDVTYLKKAVRAEVSRGIANGSTWNEVAGKLSRHMANTPFQKAYNNSIRIARTEGHRIQVQSALDAMYIAKSKGADVLKQWDATLDGATREHHQMLDGQIREVDEPFEVGGRKVEAPGMFGDPAEDCNCRCCLLQRARWALDDDELQALKDRAEYFDLDKTDEFEEYQRNYLGITREDIQKYDSQVLSALLADKYYGGIPKSWKTIEPDDNAVENANPNYKHYSYDGYSMNCPNCAVAYEMRKRGYDVTAKPYKSGGSHYLNANPWAAWDGAEVKEVYSYSDMVAIAKNSGDGARFGICFSRFNGTGHVIVGEYKNGILKLYDAQTGKAYGSLDFGRVKDVKLWRIDNLNLSDRGVTACERR